MPYTVICTLRIRIVHGRKERTKTRNLSRVSPATLKKNLALINARPKKVLHYHTPQDLFIENLSLCCT